MKILQDIFVIKNIRETRALGAVRQQDHVLSQAIADRQAAEVRLLEFRQFAQHREAELYQGLLNHPNRSIRVRDIEEVQVEVNRLLGQVGEFKSALDQAVDNQARQSDALEAFKVEHAQAYRAQQKFVELVRVHTQEDALRKERFEEGEVEPVGGSAGLASGRDGLFGA